MRQVLAASFLLFALPAAFAQRQSPTSTTPPAGPAEATAQPTAADACRKEITIYIDLSGTMKMRDPLQTNPNRIPLNFIAETLRRFVTKAGLIQPNDIVSLKYFGSIVQTQQTGKDNVAALLARLAGTDTWRAAVTGLSQTDFEKYTDFNRVFADIRDHVNNSGTPSRQIIFIASDYAEDPPASPTLSPQQRIDAFRTSLTAVQPFLSNPATNVNGRVQLVGVYAPDPAKAADRQVAAQVKSIARTAGMQLYQYNDDAVEAAATLQNYFVGSVTAAPREKNVVTIGADNRVGFTLTNPNCDSVVVTGLVVRSSTAERSIEIAPTPLVNGSREVRVELDALSSVWNQDVTVTPVLRAGTSARTETSPPFWLGDWVRLGPLAPILYPWGSRPTGSTLVTTQVTESIRATASISIRNIDPGNRPRVITIVKGTPERPTTIGFGLAAPQIPQFTTGQVTAQIDGNSVRLLSDAGPVATLTVPLAAAVLSATGDFIADVQVGGWILLIFATLITTFRMFWKNEGLSSSKQLAAWMGAIGSLFFGGFFNFLLSIRFGSLWIDDSRVWVMVGARAFFVFLASWLLLRAAIINGGWYVIERRFLPNAMAVGRRRFVNVAIWMISIGLGAGVLWTFFGSPGSPSAFDRVLIGVLQ